MSHGKLRRTRGSVPNHDTAPRPGPCRAAYSLIGTYTSTHLFIHFLTTCMSSLTATAMGSIFDSNVPLDGERATESGHRKVELQSPADLTYLIANVSRAAREKLDKHLPPNAAPDGEDVMRKRVEELLDDVSVTMRDIAVLKAEAWHSTSAIRSMRRSTACQSTAWTRVKWRQSWRKPRRVKVGHADNRR